MGTSVREVTMIMKTRKKMQLPPKERSEPTILQTKIKSKRLIIGSPALPVECLAQIQYNLSIQWSGSRSAAVR
jgi:hypothetical protein